MSEERKKKKIIIKPHTDGHQSDDDQIGDLEQENSFEKKNEFFDLKSQINLLKIEKQRLALQNDVALKNLQGKNKQLITENNLKKREIANLNQIISKLQQQNMDMKQIIDSHRHQVQSLNRKTADFHHSIQQPNPLGDPSDLINDLIAKDKQIEQLKKKLSGNNDNNRISLSQSGGIDPINGLKRVPSMTEREKSQQQIRSLKQTIEDLKRKQIAYKRQYQSMIQSKEQIIKKMSMQSDESSRKIIDNKDKVIAQMRKQLQEANKQSQYFKNQTKRLNEKIVDTQEKINRLTNQFNKQKQAITYAFQQQKQSNTKGLIQKVKKQLKQRDQTIKGKQQNIYNLQSKILIQNQQLGKFKAQIGALNQLNGYLQNSSKELEESRLKMQKALFEKQKQISELRQSYFKQMSEYKATATKQKAEVDRKCVGLEQQLIAKRYMIDKYEKQLKQEQTKQQNTQLKQQYALLDQIQELRNDKSNLTHELLDLEGRYKEQTQKLLQLQNRIVKQYESKVIELEKELRQLRQKTREQKKQLIIQNQQNKQTLQAKYTKLQMIVELLNIQKKQKNDEIQRLGEQKLKADAQMNEGKNKIDQLEKKIKERNEDYKNLQILYDELNEKYKRGVRDLQQQIEEMSMRIVEQRKKVEKRKLNENDVEEAVAKSVKGYKAKIKQLQAQLDKFRTKKVQEQQAADIKLQKLTHEISTITKEREVLQRQQLRTIKQKQQMHEMQKQKMMELITELEQNNQILNHKISILSNKQYINLNAIDKMEKELKHVKNQYALSVEEINQLLNKCKLLEEVSRQSISHMEMMRQKHDILNEQFSTVVGERNKMVDEINSAYDQINKLNRVLMSKEEQITRSRISLYQQLDQQQQQQTAPTVAKTVQFIPATISNVQTTSSYRVSAPVLSGREYPTVSNLPTVPNVQSISTYYVNQIPHRDHDCRLHEALNYGQTAARTVSYRN